MPATSSFFYFFVNILLLRPCCNCGLLHSYQHYVGVWNTPFGLLGEALLLGLRLHLLHLDRVGLSSSHVQLVVAHAQREDALVDAQTIRVEDEILKKQGNSQSWTVMFLATYG